MKATVGWSIRALLLDAAGELHRFPYARLERLWNYDPNERFPDYARPFACVAIAYVEREEHKPVLLRHVSYMRIKVDDEGRIDRTEQQRGMRLAVESVDWPFGRKSGVLNAEHLFYRKRFQGEFCWKPSPEQEKQLYRLVFSQ